MLKMLRKDVPARALAPTSGEHALRRLFTKTGYRTDRKYLPHSRGLKKVKQQVAPAP